MFLMNRFMGLRGGLSYLAWMLILPLLTTPLGFDLRATETDASEKISPEWEPKRPELRAAAQVQRQYELCLQDLLQGWQETQQELEKLAKLYPKVVELQKVLMEEDQACFTFHIEKDPLQEKPEAQRRRQALMEALRSECVFLGSPPDESLTANETAWTEAFVIKKACLAIEQLAQHAQAALIGCNYYKSLLQKADQKFLALLEKKHPPFVFENLRRQILCDCFVELIKSYFSIQLHRKQELEEEAQSAQGEPQERVLNEESIRDTPTCKPGLHYLSSLQFETLNLLLQALYFTIKDHLSYQAHNFLYETWLLKSFLNGQFPYPLPLDVVVKSQADWILHLHIRRPSFTPSKISLMDRLSYQFTYSLGPPRARCMTKAGALHAAKKIHPKPTTPAPKAADFSEPPEPDDSLARVELLQNECQTLQAQNKKERSESLLNLYGCEEPVVRQSLPPEERPPLTSELLALTAGTPLPSNPKAKRKNRAQSTPKGLSSLTSAPNPLTAPCRGTKSQAAVTSQPMNSEYVFEIRHRSILQQFEHFWDPEVHLSYRKFKALFESLGGTITYASGGSSHFRMDFPQSVDPEYTTAGYFRPHGDDAGKFGAHGMQVLREIFKRFGLVPERVRGTDFCDGRAEKSPASPFVTPLDGAE